ncbi:MAG: methionyl-tRNA formyltransferase [Patescibacteria group bacterium]
MKQFSNFVFFGSNEFSVIVLEKLCQANLIPSLVITLPDKPADRKKIPTPPPLKLTADNLQLTTLQPESLKNNPELIKTIAELKPEFGIVAAYGKIIPKSVLDLFPKGVLNLHPSLLPKYRGPSPIQTAILNGDKKTGVSIILLDEEMDHGPILAQEQAFISSDEYFTDPSKNLALQGAEALKKAVPLWLEDKISPKPQKHSQASYTKLFTWQDGKIEPNKPIKQVYNQIRALSEEPGTWLSWQMANGKWLIVKIIKAKIISNSQFLISKTIPKTGLAQFNKDLILVCKEGALLLEHVQPEGKRIMTGKEFLNGYGKYLR